MRGRLDSALAALEEVSWRSLLHPRVRKGRRGGGRWAEKLAPRPEIAAQQRDLDRDVARSIADKGRIEDRVRLEPRRGAWTFPGEGRLNPSTGGRRADRGIGFRDTEPQYDLRRYQHPNQLEREPIPPSEPGEFGSPLAGVPEAGLTRKPLGPMTPEELRYHSGFASDNADYLESRANTAEREGRPGEAAEFRRLAARWRRRADELRMEEPIGSGADPYGRPDPRTHPEYWTE